MLSWLRRHPILTGLGFSMLSVVFTLLVLLGLDIYSWVWVAHVKKTNWQGYRGPVLGKKVPGEVRIAVLGGSTAYGYGVTQEHTFPAYLERMLNARVDGPGGRVRKVTVLNLSYNGEGAVCFASTLESYAYLQPDIVLLYSGINDGPYFAYYRKPEHCYRNKSMVFGLSSYLPVRYRPILPLVVREKYFLLRYGTIDEGYRRWKEYNRKRHKAENLTPLSEEKLKEAGYRRYEHHITSLIEDVLANGGTALLVTQPYFEMGSYREWQQERLRRTLERKYRGVGRFRYVTVGELFHRRADQEYTYDGTHLTRKGNEKVAKALIEPCLDLVGRLPHR
ncbi:GDSL-type esterase/lipase family protein [Nitrospinae bacterium AH_259_B05_G02_I21]|nr:GDSL-type esterase/lipase family protein [Nitrospinae bacterium AH_259_B05_G02_I21]